MTVSYQVRDLDHPLQAVVRPPGSKSFTNRALLVAAMADGGVSKIENPLEADDTVLMRDALLQLGVLIDDADDPWLVLGTNGAVEPAEGTVIDAGASGTTARFITAICALSAEPVVIDGTARMRERPIEDLTDALKALGADVETTAGRPPVKLSRGSLHGGRVTIDASTSSQFLSALLMLAPLVGEEVVIEVADGRITSRPYVESTVQTMRAFGADVDLGESSFRIAPTGYRKTTFPVEADASAAAYPLVAAAITGGVVGIEGIPADSTQPDLAIVDHLVSMGCTTRWDGARLILSGPDRLDPLDADLNDSPDAVLALAVACLFAAGASRIRNVGNLRFKETDRLAALETELNRMGADARVVGDDLLIEPGTLTGASIETYDDHRMAMSFAVAGLRVAGVEIRDPGCVSKTWPGFFEMLEAL